MVVEVVDQLVVAHLRLAEKSVTGVVTDVVWVHNRCGLLIAQGAGFARRVLLLLLVVVSTMALSG
jgi:hypothetical protein